MNREEFLIDWCNENNIDIGKESKHWWYSPDMGSLRLNSKCFDLIAKTISPFTKEIPSNHSLMLPGSILLFRKIPVLWYANNKSISIFDSKTITMISLFDSIERYLETLK